MSRIVDLLTIALFLVAALAFSAGVYALGRAKDLEAFYWLAVGGLCLRASVDLVRPRSGAH
jgi:hypothetical protein